MMKMLKHKNIVEMKQAFFQQENEDLYLNLVLEYVPESLSRYLTSFHKKEEIIPMLNLKLFTYQLARGLNYMHQKDICHRDIKPQNILLDSTKGILKICDLGSAKQLVSTEPNVSYICSRFYRAPELIFGVQYYSTKIDIWSLGCVIGEMITGEPIFEGESSLDQIVEIIRILGTPTKEDILSMNEEYLNFNFPEKKVTPWREVLLLYLF
jgi:glycogen synthase kinase 3 beta